jgi:signal transduction histidine kinase
MRLIVFITADLVAFRHACELLEAVGMRVMRGGDGSEPPPVDPLPDLLLVDTRLVGVDAPTVVAQLRRMPRRPPILVLAEREQAEAAVAAIRMGADDVVFRPVDPLGLPMRVEGLLARRAADEARERITTMEFRNQELESFIYIVTHDMKTPVVNLQGLVGLIEQDHGKSLPAEVSDYLERLRRNAARLEELLRDLLEYPNTLRIVGPIIPRDVGAIVAAAVDGLDEMARARHVEIIVQPDFPTIPCDERRLQQVFHNLVENAIKHAQGENPRVEIAWTRKAQILRFEVRDNGPGIPAEHLTEVFRLFHRVPGTTSAGSGIGLAVARQLVEAHGGEIWCESTPGAGTTFAFNLGA